MLKPYCELLAYGFIRSPGGSRRTGQANACSPKAVTATREWRDSAPDADLYSIRSRRRLPIPLSSPAVVCLTARPASARCRLHAGTRDRLISIVYSCSCERAHCSLVLLPSYARLDDRLDAAGVAGAATGRVPAPPVARSLLVDGRVEAEAVGPICSLVRSVLNPRRERRVDAWPCAVMGAAEAASGTGMAIPWGFLILV